MSILYKILAYLIYTPAWVLDWIDYQTWNLIKLNRLIGWMLWKFGRTPSATTDIGGGLEIGYGSECDNGFFKYPAPKEAYKRYGRNP